MGINLYIAFNDIFFLYVLRGVEEKENVMSGGFENIKPNNSTTKKVPKNMLSFVVCWDHIKNPNMHNIPSYHHYQILCIFKYI